MNDRLLDGLDDEQRAAVLAPGGPLAIIAPAGSGKTRVLTRRIAHRVEMGDADAGHLLAVTFSRKAAGELKYRLDRMGIDGAINAGTFHSIALQLLRRRAQERNWEQPRVIDNKLRIVAPLLDNIQPTATRAVVQEIEWAKGQLVVPENFAMEAQLARRRLPLPPDQVAAVFSEYERELRKRHVMDFDDVLRQCARAFDIDHAFAEMQRWQFKHIFVDEFQDVSLLQLKLLRGWTNEPADLTVVGDPAQAIYSFTGVDGSSIRDFDQIFPGGRTIALRRNYRSARAIVTVAEAALGESPLGARETPRSARGTRGRVVIAAHKSEQHEAAAVADACRRAFQSGTRWDRMAVLFRTNAQSAAFEEAFQDRSIPYRLGEAQRFAAKPEVRLLLARLRKCEGSGSGKPFEQTISEFAAEELAPVDVDLAAEQQREAERDEPDRDDEAAENPMESARAILLDRGREFLESPMPYGGVAGFTSWLNADTRGETITDAAVELATFHRAKGLEWEVVFVTGLEAGLVPFGRATKPEQIDEERRLLHVALSRAEDELHCSWAATRTVGGQIRERSPSPWLRLLDGASERFRGSADPPARAHVTDMRRALAEAEPLAEVPRPRPSRRTAR